MCCYLFILWLNIDGLSNLLGLLWPWWLAVLSLLWQEVWLWSWQFTIADRILWWWCGDFNNNISWLSDNIGFETFFGIGGVGHWKEEKKQFGKSSQRQKLKVGKTTKLTRSDKAVTVHNRIAAFDHISVANLFPLLIVCKLIILHIEAKLIRWISLMKNNEENKREKRRRRN